VPSTIIMVSAMVKYTNRLKKSQTTLQKAAFDSGITLLLNIYCSKRAGLPIDTAKELREVYKCMTLLRQCERR
jgi:hypothetical protein